MPRLAQFWQIGVLLPLQWISRPYFMVVHGNTSTQHQTGSQDENALGDDEDSEAPLLGDSEDLGR